MSDRAGFIAASYGFASIAIGVVFVIVVVVCRRRRLRRFCHRAPCRMDLSRAKISLAALIASCSLARAGLCLRSGHGAAIVTSRQLSEAIL